MISDNIIDKIKVCHVTSAHPRYDLRIFHKECKSLVNNGFDVILLVNDSIQNESIEGIRIVSTQLHSKNRFDRMIRSKKSLKSLIIEIDADIYHFHDPELLPEAAWIKRKGKKVIFDFHEDVSQQILFKKWIPQKLRYLISIIYKKYEKNKGKRFDALITVTPKFVEQLQKINPNTVMITNYPILKEIVKCDELKKNTICFAGGIDPQWCHEKIINAIESIEDVEYLLAGNGLQDYLEILRKLDGWKKVKYLGRILHEEVIEMYGKSRIGMTLLSNNTQVGNEGTLGNTKIFEFMEAGIPVICSNNKLWKAIIDKYKCGIYVDPDNVEEIKKIIEYLLSNDEIAEEMGNNGRKAIVKEYNWNSQALKLIKCYKGL